MSKIIKGLICFVLIVIACFGTSSKTVFSMDECTCENGEFVAWNNDATLPTKSGKYYLTKDVNLNDIQYINGNNDVHICLNGHKVIQTKERSEVFILSDNASLSIYDCTESGKPEDNYVAGIITGGKNGAIRLTDSEDNNGEYATTFNLYGGIIADNSSIDYGGALVLEGHSTFNMYGGLFKNNNSYLCGGAVYAKDFSNVNLLGGAFIGNETNQDGGAVYLFTASNGFVDGTVFLNNSSIYDGGAIYLEAVDTFLQVDSGTFKHNKSKTSGGGAIGVFTQGTMLMNNADISENEAVYGGGIWIRKAYCTINNANITNNKASESGGGIQAQGIDIPFQTNCLVLNNAYIANNEAPLGGGIYIGGTSKVNLRKGIIENNKATNGGGVYVGTLGYGIIEEIEIKNNEALEDGGGLYCLRGSKTFLYNPTITENIANNAGGIFVDDDFSITSGNISNNKATSGVGGVYISSADYDGESYYSSIIKMDGDLYIYDNEGKNKNLYISKNSMIHGTNDGFGENAKIGVEIEEKDLYKVFVGKYDYKKSGKEYLITKGDEYIIKDSNNVLLYVGIGVVLALVIIYLNRNKLFKKGEKA